MQPQSYLSNSDRALINKVLTDTPASTNVELPLDDRLVYFSSLAKIKPRPSEPLYIVQDHFEFNGQDQNPEAARRIWVLINATRIRLLAAAMQMPRVFHWALPYDDPMNSVDYALRYFIDRQINFFDQYDKLLISGRFNLDGMRCYVCFEVALQHVSAHGTAAAYHIHCVSFTYISDYEQQKNIFGELTQRLEELLGRALEPSVDSIRDPLSPNPSLADAFVSAGKTLLTASASKAFTEVEAQARFFKVIQWASESCGPSHFSVENINWDGIIDEVAACLQARVLLLTDGSSGVVPYPTSPQDALLNPLPMPRVVPSKLLDLYQSAKAVFQVPSEGGSAVAAKGNVGAPLNAAAAAPAAPTIRKRLRHNNALSSSSSLTVNVLLDAKTAQQQITGTAQTAFDSYGNENRADREALALEVLGRSLNAWTAVPPAGGQTSTMSNATFEGLISMRFYEAVTANAFAYFMLVETLRVYPTPATYESLFGHLDQTNFNTHVSTLRNKLYELLTSTDPWNGKRVEDIASLMSIDDLPGVQDDPFLSGKTIAAAATNVTGAQRRPLTSWLGTMMSARYRDDSRMHEVFATVAQHMYTTLAASESVPFGLLRKWLRQLEEADVTGKTAEDSTTSLYTQTHAVLEYARELNSLYASLQAHVARAETYARYASRLNLFRLYAGFMYVTKGLRYFFVGNSLLVNRMVMPALSKIDVRYDPTLLKLSYNPHVEELASAFAKLALSAFGLNEDPAFHVLVKDNALLVLDQTRLSPYERVDDSRIDTRSCCSMVEISKSNSSSDRLWQSTIGKPLSLVIISSSW